MRKNDKHGVGEVREAAAQPSKKHRDLAEATHAKQAVGHEVASRENDAPGSPGIGGPDDRIRQLDGHKHGVSIIGLGNADSASHAETDHVSTIAFLDHVASASDVNAERPHLLALARRLSLNPHDANDLVQDALVRALPALGRVAVGSHLRAWLMTILRHIHIDRLRRRAREPQVVPIDEVHEALEVLVVEEPVVEPTDAVDLDDLREALRALPEMFREVVVLHELEGRSYREISRVLDIPLATVGTRLSRSRLKLQRLLVARRTTGRRSRSRRRPGEP